MPELTRHDYALCEDETGGVQLHRADCPEARRLAAAGYPVFSMFGVAKKPPDDLTRHDCLGADE